MEKGSVTKKNPALNVRANVLINLIRTLALTLLSFITFPFITRALGDSVFGTYTWANTFVYYFLILSRISIPNIAIRECAKARGDKERFNTIVQEFFLMQAIMTLISFGLMSSMVLTVPGLRENSQLIFLLSINFLVGVFSFEWVYIALEKHFYITVRSIFLIAFSALLVFTLIPSGSNNPEFYLYTYAFLAILSTILTVFFNCLYLPRFVSLKKTQKYNFKRYFSSLWVLFLISLLLAFYNQTDEFILGYLDASKASVGAYSVGVKGIDIIITLITSLYAVFMPRASYYYEMEDKRYFRNIIAYSINITFFISVPAIATMATMSKEICLLISGGKDLYSSSYLVLSILASMMLTYSLADNIYTEILIPMKREKEYMLAMSIGVTLNIALSLLLGLAFKQIDPLNKEYPLIGVALATAATDLALILYLLIRTREYSSKAVFNLNNFKIVIIGGVIAVISIFLTPLLEGLFPFQEAWQKALLAMLIVLLIDAIIYVFGLLLLKENLVSSFMPKRRKEREEYEKSQSEGK